MKRKLTALGLTATMFAAIGVLLLSAPTASAQEQAAPWYMPQAWVYPPQTGPQIRKLPGSYGYSNSYRTYGTFRSCYGSCNRLPGTISAGYGLILSRPVMADYTTGNYQLEPLATEPQPAPSQQSRRPAQPLVVSVGTPRGGARPQAKFSMQNGVRVIRPSAFEAY